MRERATGEEHTIAFDEEAYSLGLPGCGEYDTDIMRFSYSSMTTPARSTTTICARASARLRKTQEVPSGHDPDELCHAPAHGPGA